MKNTDVPHDDEITWDAHDRSNQEDGILRQPGRSELVVGVILSLIVVIIGIILLW